jgi:hypothetical protein
MINLRSLADDPRLKLLSRDQRQVASLRPAEDQHRQGKFSEKDYQT